MRVEDEGVEEECEERKREWRRSVSREERVEKECK